MRTLNLGILAHVDAGKTSLTERLLYAAKVIDKPGSVDAGNTQTDTLAQERARGITIKAAVVAFELEGVTVNLIDTPGHPDFIAEVERVVSLLDGAVLVVSAVEGVQAQTRVLMRTLKRLGVPTLIFINKIDRLGADPEAVLARIAGTLTADVVTMGEAVEAGRRAAEFRPGRMARTPLAERLTLHDEDLLRDWLEDEAGVTDARLDEALVALSRAGKVHPVFFGSAITGAGIPELMAALTALLPAPEADDAAPLSASVFKVERGQAGERIAVVRVHAGALHRREKVWAAGEERRITSLEIYEAGRLAPAETLGAGRIGRLRGLGEVRIGDVLGEARAGAGQHHFAPPTLETAIAPARLSEKGALHAALAQLTEQDPLINLRQDDLRGELYLSLYGEVQKEVIRDTLAADFGLEAVFHETTPICIERLVGTGDALIEPPWPFMARVGLRIEPLPLGSGVQFKLEVESGAMPASFFKAVEEAARETLGQGLKGWEVRDCLVAMTHVIRYRHFATSTPADHRHLTPLVLMRALKMAETVVCEPIHHFHLSVPEEAVPGVINALGHVEALLQDQSVQGRSVVLEGEIAAARIHQLQQVLPGLTHGEGALECVFDHHRPVRGDPPERPRTDNNPLDRTEYLKNVRMRP
ncbi:MAG: translation factor GTPase family protein [Caulobacteraceae bacterium]